HRLAAELLTQADHGARFIAEHQIERDLRVELLVDGDRTGQLWRARGVVGVRDRREKQDQQENDTSGGHWSHCGFPTTGSPCFTTSSLATSIGNRTTPFCLSIHPGLRSA